MSKRNTIMYWIATAWLSLGMISTGIVQLIQLPEEVTMITRLGYPLYFLTLIAVWKFFGVLAILAPKFPRLKEWAYAGFFFNASGAVYSHVAVGDSFSELFGPTLLLVLTLISWYFRPEHRKLH